MQNNKLRYTVVERNPKPTDSPGNEIYVPVGNSLIKEAWQSTGAMFSSFGEKLGKVSLPAGKVLPKKPKDCIAVMVIAMMLVSVPNLGFVLAKDTQIRTGEKVAGVITEAASETYPVMSAKLTETLDNIKLKIAPIVKGMQEKAAIEELKKADIPVKEVKHEKMTYKTLVEKSDDLFFGEVQTQSQDFEGVDLVIADADMSDELTVEMVNFGSRLAWPVPGYERLSSHFGHRSSPGGIGSTNHQGIDIPAPTGTPIIAVKEGTVKTAGPSGGYGNCVVIDHENGYETLYGHMSQITCNAGDKVKPGDVIGKIGSTGNSTGPHLHFGILKNGVYVDPEPYLTGRELVKPGEEVSENLTENEPAQTQPSSGENNKKKDKEQTTTTQAPTTKPTETTEPPAPEPTTQPEPKPTEPAPQPTQPPEQPTSPPSQDDSGGDTAESGSEE